MAIYKMEIQLSDGNVINAGTFEVKDGGKPRQKSVTLTVGGWAKSSAPEGYKYVIEDADISADSIVDFIQDNSSAEAWAGIGAYPMTVSTNGSVALYAENKPVVNIKGYYSIMAADISISEPTYEERVAAAYPDYTILHGTLNTPAGSPIELEITSGTIAAGKKAILIDSVVIDVSDPILSNVFVGSGNGGYFTANEYPDEYPTVTPAITANTTLLLWDGSKLSSKENEEV